MATVNIQATAICAGGNHITITASIAGGASRVFAFNIAELQAALDGEAGITVRDTILALIEIHAIGKTAAQLKSDLQAGLSVTI